MCTNNLFRFRGEDTLFLLFNRYTTSDNWNFPTFPHPLPTLRTHTRAHARKCIFGGGVGKVHVLSSANGIYSIIVDFDGAGIPWVPKRSPTEAK